jgi:glucose-6-phosphate isomerase
MKNNQTTESRALLFNLDDGLSPSVNSIRRMLSQMRGMYHDEKAYTDQLREEDLLIYEFYDLGIPSNSNELAYGTTILYPGKIGDEYFMTKGHFHSKIETAEVYYCIKGHGFLMMENPEGTVEIKEMTPGISVYVPPRFAHRSINISPHEALVSFFAFRADAGHDYKTIETKGFRKLIIEKNGKPIILESPKWK